MTSVPISDGCSAEPPTAASRALLKASIKPEASRMTTVEPTKNQGRFLNVSQPKRKADPVENSMAAPYHAATLGEVDRTDFHNS